MNQNDLFAAQTQARITYSLLGGFLGLMFALLVVACLPFSINDKLLAVLDRIVTAMLPIVGGAVGFWTARHRPPSIDDPVVTVTASPPVVAVPLDPSKPKV